MRHPPSRSSRGRPRSPVRTARSERQRRSGSTRSRTARHCVQPGVHRRQRVAAQARVLGQVDAAARPRRRARRSRSAARSRPGAAARQVERQRPAGDRERQRRAAGRTEVLEHGQVAGHPRTSQRHGSLTRASCSWPRGTTSWYWSKPVAAVQARPARRAASSGNMWAPNGSTRPLSRRGARRKRYSLKARTVLGRSSPPGHHVAGPRPAPRTVVPAATRPVGAVDDQLGPGHDAPHRRRAEQVEPGDPVRPAGRQQGRERLVERCTRSLSTRQRRCAAARARSRPTRSPRSAPSRRPWRRTARGLGRARARAPRRRRSAARARARGARTCPRVPWFLPWMSAAIAPPTVTCCVPGTTGSTQPARHQRGQQLAEGDAGVGGEDAAVELEAAQRGHVEHEAVAPLGGVAVAAAHPARDRSRRRRGRRSATAARSSSIPRARTTSAGTRAPPPQPDTARVGRGVRRHRGRECRRSAGGMDAEREQDQPDQCARRQPAIASSVSSGASPPPARTSAP